MCKGSQLYLNLSTIKPIRDFFQSILYAPTEPLCFQFRSFDIKEIKLN